MAIEWTEDLSVGVAEIDEQHKIFIEILNELTESMKAEKAEKLIPVILEKLQAFARFHFRTEEGYFIQFDYDGTEAHIAEHRRLSGKVHDFILRYKEGTSVTIGELVFFLGDWATNHLKEMDQLYMPCFLEHGLK